MKKSSINRDVEDANIDLKRQSEMAEANCSNAVMNLSEICEKGNGSECKKSSVLSKGVNLISKINILMGKGVRKSLVHLGHENKREDDGVKHSFCSEIEQAFVVNSKEYTENYVPTDHLAKLSNNSDTLEYLETFFPECCTFHIEQRTRNRKTLIQSDIGDEIEILGQGLKGDNFQVSLPLHYYDPSEKSNQGNLEIKTTCRSSDYCQIGSVKQIDQQLPLEWSAYLSNSPTGWNEFWNQYGEQLVWSDWCEKFQESFASLHLSLGEIFFLHQNDLLNYNVLCCQNPS